MSLEELKQEIELQTGVPASLLIGETAEENIAQAKALLAYKREAEAQKPKSPREQFAEWINGGECSNGSGEALQAIEEKVRVEAGGYPITQDGGEALNMPDMRPTREQFSEWLNRIF